MVIGYILLFLAVIAVALGIRFIFGYQRSQATVWYGLFCIAAAIYIGANGANYIFGNEVFQGERWAWFGGISATIFILPFSFSYPFARKSIKELLPLVVWPVAVFLPSLMFTDVFIKDPIHFIQKVGVQTGTGEFFWFMMVFMAVYWLWAIINLFFQTRHSDGMHRRNLLFITVGTVISLSVSAYSDVIHPLVTVSQIGYLGSLCNFVWLGCTSYILLKK